MARTHCYGVGVHTYSMKKYLPIIIILSLGLSHLIYGQTDQYILLNRLPHWADEHLYKAKFHDDYKLSAFINPFYLEADFNGDGNIDIAITIENKASGKKGFVFLHNSTNQHFYIGAGTKFDNGGDDFRWMDIWKVHRNLDAHKLTYKEDGDIDDSKPLKLKNVGIDVIKSESAGGIIYWDGQTYKWSQTSD